VPADRLQSIVEVLNVQPDDRVLEIAAGMELRRRWFASGSTEAG